MKQRKVIHLEYAGGHYYFGSLKAMCNEFGTEKLGMSYSTMRNMRISEDNPFTHPKLGYIVREGVLKAATINTTSEVIDNG